MSTSGDQIPRRLGRETLALTRLWHEPDLHWAPRRETLELAAVVGRRELTLLVGRPGSGRTTLLTLLARAVAFPRPEVISRIPNSLLGRPLYRSSVVALQAGCTYVNELEGRITRVAEAVRMGDEDAPAKGVLCIEDVHQAGTAGATTVDPGGTIAKILIPLIGDGLRVLGTTTPQGLESLHSTAPDFVSGARIFRLEDASEETTLELLEHVRCVDPSRWSPAAIATSVELSSRLMRHRSFPGKAFELLREAEKDGLELAERADVVAAVSSLSGLTRAMVDDKISLRLTDVAAELAKHVIDQPEAIQAAARTLVRLKTGMAPGNRPVGSIFLTGGTGTGKTTLARAIALAAYGSERAVIRHDMSEYVGYDAVDRFIGTARRSQGLAEQVAAQPFSVVLLDEIEKADFPVHLALLQVLEDGRLTSGAGVTADFSSSIVVLTSNLGSGDEHGPIGFRQCLASDRTEQLKRTLSAAFPPEFVNRLDEAVALRPLGSIAIGRIARREVDVVAASAPLRTRELELEITSEMWDQLAAEGYEPRLGARAMLRAVRRLVTDPIAETLAGDPDLRRARIVIAAGGLSVSRAVTNHASGSVTPHEL